MYSLTLCAQVSQRRGRPFPTKHVQGALSLHLKIKIEFSPDALRHRASPQGLQGQEVQAGEALPEQGGFCTHHEKLAGLEQMIR